MRVGTAQIEITPDRAIPIAGLMRARLGEYAHDPLELSAVALDAGGPRVVIVSCDLLLLPDAFVAGVRQSCAGRFGIDAAAVLIACTHTHCAPCTADFFPGQVDPAFMTRLGEALVSVVGEALADAEEVLLYAGEGWLDEMGFNRRGLRPDGSVEFNYGSWHDDFAGLAGPRDGSVPVLWAQARSGRTKAVVASFATHPTAVIDSYYSADLAGAVRRFVRRELGGDAGVVYLTGAAGNTAQKQLDHNEEMAFPWRGQDGMDRAGACLGGQILSVMGRPVEPMAEPILRLAQTAVPVPVRPWPESFDPRALEPGFGDYYRKSREDWPRLIRRESPVPVRLSVVRVGDAAICTNPAELYVEHGLAIRDGSPAGVTLISELTDGYVGFVPTREAFVQGGYSTWPAPSSKLDPGAGDLIVEHTRRLLGAVF